MAKLALPVVIAAGSDCRPPRPVVQPKATAAYTKLFKALGDETRLQILGLIAASGTQELCVCDIESHFHLSQATISHHLKLLKEAEILTAERRGTWVYYALHRDTLRRLASFQALMEG